MQALGIFFQIIYLKLISWKVNILVLRRDRSYFVKEQKKKYTNKQTIKNKKTRWFYQKFLWNWHQHARVFYWQHICYAWWICFSTDSRHTYAYGYKLCSSSCRLVPLIFVWGRLHTGDSQEKRKEGSPIL